MTNIKRKHPRKISTSPSLYVVLNAFRSASLKLILCDMMRLLGRVVAAREYFVEPSSLKSIH